MWLDDVHVKPGTLTLLQFALRDMWACQEQRTILHRSYTDVGRVEGALARHADKVFGKLTRSGADGDTVKAFQRLFTRLVMPGEDRQDTRRVVKRQELDDDAWSLAQRLAGEENRLVVTNKPADAPETAEIVHEALIKHWPRLDKWIEEDRDFQLWQRRIMDEVKVWSANPTDEGTLLRGSALAVAKENLHQRGDDIN